MVKVTVKTVTTNQALIKNITRKIPSRVSPRLNNVGRDAVVYIHDFLNANFKKRPNQNRRNTDMDEGYSRLHDSFSYEVINNLQGGRGKINMTVELSSSANPRLISIIEKGSKAHRISGVKRPDKSVLFPSTARGDKITQAIGVDPNGLTRQLSVRHPGTKKYSQGKNTPWKIALNRAIKKHTR